MSLDHLLRLRERHPGDVDAPVGAEIDRAVRADKMLSGHLLLPRGLGERERDLRLPQHALEVAENGILGLVERFAADGNLPVGGAEVEEAARFDDVDPVDRLFEEGSLDDHLERIERLDPERRLRHDPQRVDEEDVRRLDDVRGERHLRQFLRGHLGRIAIAIGSQGGLVRRRPLGAAVDIAANARQEQQGRHHEAHHSAMVGEEGLQAPHGDGDGSLAISGHASLLAGR